MTTASAAEAASFLYFGGTLRLRSGQALEAVPFPFVSPTLSQSARRFSLAPPGMMTSQHKVPPLRRAPLSRCSAPVGMTGLERLIRSATQAKIGIEWATSTTQGPSTAQSTALAVFCFGRDDRVGEADKVPTQAKIGIEWVNSRNTRSLHCAEHRSRGVLLRSG